MTVVLDHVLAHVDAQAGKILAVQAAVVIHRDVTDRAGRQFGVSARRLAIGKAAAATEGGVAPGSWGAALEAAGRDHVLKLSPRAAPQIASPIAGSTLVTLTCHAG